MDKNDVKFWRTVGKSIGKVSEEVRSNGADLATVVILKSLALAILQGVEAVKGDIDETPDR